MHPSELMTEEPSHAPVVESSSEEPEKVDEPTADQIDKEEETVSSSEVPSPVVPAEEETKPEEPEKEVEAHIESDPVDADELDEEEALNPIDTEENVNQPHLVTDAPSPVESENLVTSGPESVSGQDESSNAEHDGQSSSAGTESEVVTNVPEDVSSHSQEAAEETKPDSSDKEVSSQESTESTSSDIAAAGSEHEGSPATDQQESVNETPVHSDQTETDSEGQLPLATEEPSQLNVEDKLAENESGKPENEVNSVEEQSSETEVTPPKETSSDSQEEPQSAVPNSDLPEESSTNKVEQSEVANESLSVQESTNPSIPESPESLDQIKASETEKDTLTATHDAVENDKESQEPVISSTDSTEPEKQLENEAFVREPVPPRKDDAVPEEPEQKPQHPEGSMTKAEDSDPSNVNAPVTEVVENVGVSENDEETATSSEPHSHAENEDTKPEHDDSANEEISEIDPPKEVSENTGEVSDVQTEQPAPETPIENSIQSQDASNEHVEPSHDDDSNESEATTDNLKPNKDVISEESTTLPAEGEAVPSIIVTENESSIVSDKIPEDKDENHSNVQISQDSNNDDEDNGHTSQTEKPGVTIEEHSTELQHENPDLDVKPSNEESAAEPTQEEESQKPAETSNDNIDSESSTKENEIPKESEEVTSSIKEDENIPSVTENVEPPSSEQIHDETESSENEVNPEQPHVQPNDITEPQTNEESSTDPLVKVGEGQPDSAVSENAPEESKPVDTPIEAHANNAAGGIETNEFQEVEHDPVESDPTDFEEQEEPIQHIHDEFSSENEIVDENHSGQGGSLEHKPFAPPLGPMGIIPGEGDCLVDGITYTNSSVIPSKSPCHKECTCMSSIVHCQGIDCPPPPPQLANCMPVHQGDLCCPVYTCGKFFFLSAS